MSPRLRRPSGDEGLGMIMVIGISGVVFTLAFVAVAYALNGLAQSRARTGFELSLAVSEAGIDRTLGELQEAFTSYNQDYPVPNAPTVFEPTPWCNATPVEYPVSAPGGVFASEADERTWARDVLEDLVPVTGCVQSGAQGEYVVLKPVSPLVGGLYPKSGKVYSLSAVPSFSDPESKTRLLKSEYVFMPYRPTHAILAGGPLTVSSSTTVQSAYGIPPEAASIHSNATVSGDGNPTSTGPVTSTDASSFSSNNFPGDTVTSAPVQRIPRVDAEAFYYQAAANDPTAISTWYDLCPDGQVLPYAGALGPCGSTEPSLGTATTSAKVLGWNYDATARQWTGTPDIQPGTYFAKHSNIINGTGNPEFSRLTLIAMAENLDDCATKQYGNIEWDRYDIKVPAFKNLWMYADTDVVTGSNFNAGSGITAPPVVSGMFIAGDQMSLQTSSSGAVGAVAIADNCETPPTRGRVTVNEVKNPTIYFDPNSDAPFTSVITTSLWLDYSGG